LADKLYQALKSKRFFKKLNHTKLQSLHGFFFEQERERSPTVICQDGRLDDTIFADFSLGALSVLRLLIDIVLLLPLSKIN